MRRWLKITIKDLRGRAAGARCLREELAVRDACEKITEEQLKELRRSNAAFKNSACPGDDIFGQRARRRYGFSSEIIYKATDNRRLMQILNNLRGKQMYRYRMEYLKRQEMHPGTLRREA